MSDEKPVVEKQEPDFEGMSILQLLQYDQSLKDQDKGYGTTEHLDKWLSTVQDSIPFYGIIESIDCLENDKDVIDERLKNLEAKFTRLLKLLDNKTGIHSPDNPLMITVREYMEGKIK